MSVNQPLQTRGQKAQAHHDLHFPCNRQNEMVEIYQIGNEKGDKRD